MKWKYEISCYPFLGKYKDQVCFKIVIHIPSEFQIQSYKALDISRFVLIIVAHNLYLYAKGKLYFHLNYDLKYCKINSLPIIHG